jgi:hypothetical protein
MKGGLLILCIMLVLSLTAIPAGIVSADCPPGETLETTLQPGPAEGKDTWVYALMPTWNFGAGVYTRTGLAFDEGKEDNYAARTYIEFDLSSLPAGVEIDSAVFSIYEYSCYESETGHECVTEDYAIYRVLSAWNEGNKTGTVGDLGEIYWTTQPLFDSTAYGQRSVSLDPNDPYKEQWLDFDITYLVRKWYDGIETNYGMVLKQVDETTVSMFHANTSDWTTASERPKLTIKYTCPGDRTTVGGDVFPVDKTGLIVPWIVLATAAIAGSIYVVRCRALSSK